MAEITQEMRIVEALLFAATQPVSESFLAERLPEDADVPQVLAGLKALYMFQGL